MQEKVYFLLFTLCIIFSKGIDGTFSEDNVGESSNLLVREKRVINRQPGGDVAVNIGAVPYAVNIKFRNLVSCVGSILSHHTVITAARCVSLDISMYTVHSGSTYSYHDTRHNVTEKKMHGHDASRASTFLTGIALLTVDPPFEYSRTTRRIDLYTGLVLPGMHGTVSGWASYVYGGARESEHSRRLRSISVPVMKHQECVHAYRNYFPITEEDICTYHPQRLCGHTDGGAPLVIDNQLVGVHIGAIDTAGQQIPIKPDVFVFLQDSNYRSWIMRNIVP